MGGVPEAVRQSIWTEELSRAIAEGRFRLRIDGSTYKLELQQTLHDTYFFAVSKIPPAPPPIFPARDNV